MTGLLAHGPLRYRALIGTGGIGSGRFFLLQGNQPLGREESRGGRFLDQRDYCKLHIVCHYVKVLLGEGFDVIPVGRVGDDTEGRELMEEMARVGLRLEHLERLPGKSTLFSFCYVYPDGDGGNMTTDDSACSDVTELTIERAESVFQQYRGGAVAVALPEVPLNARRRLLDLATRYGLLRAASFTAGELRDPDTRDLFAQLDLLALNIEEAAAAADIPSENRPAESVAGEAIRRLSRSHPALCLSVTAGVSGSWLRDGDDVHYRPALPVQSQSSAGAGDAHLSGILAGLCLGLSPPGAQGLGTLVAAASVTSAHTIHKSLSRPELANLCREHGTGIESVVPFLAPCED